MLEDPSGDEHQGQEHQGIQVQELQDDVQQVHVGRGEAGGAGGLGLEVNTKLGGL